MVLGRTSDLRSASPTALWVVPVSELGGVARHVLDVARVGLPGWRLVVLCPEGLLAERLRERGTPVIAAPFGPSAGFRVSLAALRKNVKRLRPDVVHSHLAYADVVATAAVIGLGTTLVTTEHGIAGDDMVYHGSQWKSRIKALMHRLRLRRANAVIAVSKATRDAMLKKWQPRQVISIIPNGVDAAEVRLQVDALRADNGGNHAGLRVLSLSRLSPEKNLDVLLRAFANISASRPDTTLMIAGEGEELERLKCVAEQLGVQHSVRFPGFVDPLQAMANSDVLVQLSVWENCSYTLLDAVSAGLGVVATDVGGNSEILPSECLVSGESITEIARSIEARAIPAATLRDSSTDWLDVRGMALGITDTYAELFT